MTLSAAQYWGETLKQWDLDGLAVALTCYPAQQRQSRHRHENPTFFFLLDGQFEDASKELGRLSPARFQLLFHPSGAWHEGASGPQGRLGINLEPSENWLLKNGLSPRDLGPYRLEVDPMLCSELMRLALHGFQAPGAGDRLAELLVCPEPDLSETPAWFRKLEGLLNSGTSWRLNGLAREVGVHPVYLARVFRTRYGCSVTEWLSRRRLLEATEALLQGRAASHVAHQAGFADQAHFGRVFRAFTGKAPRAFQCAVREEGFISSSLPRGE